MNKQITRILVVLASILVAIATLYNREKVLGTPAHQVGNILFTWPNSTTHSPIFTETDFKPGDCVLKTVAVDNQGAGNAIIGVYSDSETDSDALSSVLTIEIIDVGNIYGPETLATFASDSDVLNQIQLSNLAGGNQTTYDFEVCFPENAGNEHQGNSVSFDLKFGEIPPPIELPAVCADLEGIITVQIDGTPGDDNINGTSASEFIRGFGGNDRIRGKGGHDCIIGGPGNDRGWGGSGNDIITGDAGEDRIRGGSGHDVIHGGTEDDRINGGTGDDTIFGDLGNDRLRGSSGIDLVFGGEGADRIRGGSGADVLLGEAGDDNIRGGSGDDFLDGGVDIDNLNGNSGIDTCVGGEFLTSCEF